MKVPIAGGSGVRMYSPPNPKLSTDETISCWNCAKQRSFLSGRQREDKHDVRYLGLTLASLLLFYDGDPITDCSTVDLAPQAHSCEVTWPKRIVATASVKGTLMAMKQIAYFYNAKLRDDETDIDLDGRFHSSRARPNLAPTRRKVLEG